MRQLTILYDPHCGLCRRAHGWLLSQPKYIELIFIPINSEEALYRYPKLNHALTLTEVTVIGDDGAVFWGAKAWLMCLWALRNYRDWSYRLSSPALLPTAKNVVSMISQNRQNLEGVGKLVLRDYR